MLANFFKVIGYCEKEMWLQTVVDNTLTFQKLNLNVPLCRQVCVANVSISYKIQIEILLHIRMDLIMPLINDPEQIMLNPVLNLTHIGSFHKY